VDRTDSQSAWLGLNSYEPRGPFLKFHGRDKRWAVMVAHRRAGKTVACIADLVLEAICTRKQDARYAYIAPQYNQAKDIAWLYVKRLTADIPGVTYNEAELRANLPNGAQVRLYGADNPDRLRGMYLDGCILDEHADMRPRVWGEIVRPMLADRKGWAAFIGTPKGHNEFYRVWQEADQDWFRLCLKGSESGLIEQSELDAMRKSMTEDQYEQEVECSFEAAIQGAILGRYMTVAESTGRINACAYDPGGAPIEISSDIGFHDTAAWWFWQPKFGGFSLIDYDEGTGMDAPEWAKRLNEKCEANGYRLGKVWLPHDARGKTFAAQHTAQEWFWKAFGTEKVDIVPMTSKADRINAARTVIGQCEFNQVQCFAGIEALKQWRFKWDEDRKEFSKEPEHDWASHPGDGFSYGAQIMRERVVKPQEKPALFPQHRTIDQMIAHRTKQRLQEA
jgi:phage terminase large subunit